MHRLQWNLRAKTAAIFNRFGILSHLALTDAHVVGQPADVHVGGLEFHQLLLQTGAAQLLVVEERRVRVHIGINALVHQDCILADLLIVHQLVEYEK